LAFKSYLLEDLKLVSLELCTSIISKALEIFKKLEITSIKKSLKLIKAFSNLLAFKKLKIQDLYICNFCFKIISSKTTIHKHYSLEYKNSKINSIYKAIKE